MRRNLQRHSLAVHHFERLARHGAGYPELVHPVRDGRRADQHHVRRRANDDGQGHLFTAPPSSLPVVAHGIVHATDGGYEAGAITQEAVVGANIRDAGLRVGQPLLSPLDYTGHSSLSRFRFGWLGYIAVSYPQAGRWAWISSWTGPLSTTFGGSGRSSASCQRSSMSLGDGQPMPSATTSSVKP